MDAPKDFSERLDTFKTFDLKNDIITLAKLGFYHTGKGIINCTYCDTKFINWDGNDIFYIKHHQSGCEFVKKDYLYVGSSTHGQSVTDWMDKVKETYPDKLDGIEEEYLYFIIFRYLYMKGEYANIDEFEKFFDYITSN
jgi:hypothetical protein